MSITSPEGVYNEVEKRTSLPASLNDSNIQSSGNDLIDFRKRFFFIHNFTSSFFPFVLCRIVV